jgi:hypothetical protein
MEQLITCLPFRETIAYQSGAEEARQVTSPPSLGDSRQNFPETVPIMCMLSVYYSYTEYSCN